MLFHKCNKFPKWGGGVYYTNIGSKCHSLTAFGNLSASVFSLLDKPSLKDPFLLISSLPPPALL
ncbi:hypothetical protein SAMN00808754_0198 [Thermanaeromonas toyohensis ToBE]|uniref:Uncharacterized protein n=1 Tax=Thermanaeromonas toyohensis ToBE TaxID=698762 RepID=A0A1W1V8T5_9FIRM|nr:hypothetical protein SAMN00808754_0198 [Thermanaeromonas toyohensis ToBE]